MSLGEVSDFMNQVGAVRHDGVYPQPWTSPAKDGKPATHGYRICFLLRDKTTVMLDVQSIPSSSNKEGKNKVVGFEVGSPGRGYGDKLVWTKDSEEGWHRFPSELDLNDPHRPEGKFEGVSPRD